MAFLVESDGLIELLGTRVVGRTCQYGGAADNRPVAALVAYPGEGYMDCRKRTFDLLGSLITFDAEKMEPEARDGEYYLDSISVHPHWRGKGIARVMMAEAAREAARMGATTVAKMIAFTHS